MDPLAGGRLEVRESHDGAEVDRRDVGGQVVAARSRVGRHATQHNRADMRTGWAGPIAGAMIILAATVGCDPATGGPASSPPPAPTGGASMTTDLRLHEAAADGDVGEIERLLGRASRSTPGTPTAARR